MVVLDYIYTTFLVIWSKCGATIIGGFLLTFVISSNRTLREGDYQFWEGCIISAVVWLLLLHQYHKSYLLFPDKSTPTTQQTTTNPDL